MHLFVREIYILGGQLEFSCFRYITVYFDDNGPTKNFIFCIIYLITYIKESDIF
jgi:hypothetical protein